LVKDRKEVLDHIAAWIVNCKLPASALCGFHRESFVEVGCLQDIKKDLIAGEFPKVVRGIYIFFQRAGGNVDILKGFIDGTCFGKGIGYASESTFLGNFLRAGEDFQEPPTLVCKLYAYKHVDFLIRMEQIGTQHGPDGLVERCGDIILYSGLGYAIQQLGH